MQSSEPAVARLLRGGSRRLHPPYETKSGVANLSGDPFSGLKSRFHQPRSETAQPSEAWEAIRIIVADLKSRFMATP